MTHIPALILALTLTAYWGQVLRLVYKIRRRTGHSAGLAPPERLGMVLRLIWCPLVLVWVIHPYFVAFSAKLPVALSPLFTAPAAAWPASAIAALALLATMLCWRKMGSSWRMGIDPAEKTRLIVTGPYAYVRHPIYALSSLLMLATIVVVPSPLMLVIALLHLLLLRWETHREEVHLLSHHGDAYLDYSHRVARFIPRSLRPYDAPRQDDTTLVTTAVVAEPSPSHGERTRV